MSPCGRFGFIRCPKQPNQPNEVNLVRSLWLSLPLYCFSSSTQNTKAWKRKKMIMGRVMRWMMTQTTVPSTSDSMAPACTLCVSNVFIIHMAKLKNMKKVHTFLPCIPEALFFDDICCYMKKVRTFISPSYAVVHLNLDRQYDTSDCPQLNKSIDFSNIYVYTYLAL